MAAVNWDDVCDHHKKAALGAIAALVEEMRTESKRLDEPARSEVEDVALAVALAFVKLGDGLGETLH